MSNTIILKKSGVGAKSPITSDLALGEIALNYSDGFIFYRDNEATPAVHKLNADNADTVDGYHLNQDVRTTASPTFAGLTVDTNTLFVDATNDRVGIGTTSPNSPLQVYGNAKFGASPSATVTAGSNGLTLNAGANKIGFTNGSAEIRSAGSLSIDLDNNNNQTDEYFAITQNNGANELFRIKADGNVGIGTTAPTEKLTVAGNIKINKTDDTIARLSILTDKAFGREFYLENNGTTQEIVAENTLTIRTLNNDNKIILEGGSNTDNIQFVTDEVERMRVTNTGLGIGTTSPARKLHVSTGNTDVAAKFENATSNGTVLEITTSGDNKTLNIQSDHIYTNTNLHLGHDSYQTYIRGASVGIGTTAPATKLHVGTGSGATVDTAYQIVADSSGIAGIQILASATQSSRVVFGDSSDNDIGMVKYDHANNAMSFNTNASEKVRITSAGNVGIGTSSPDDGDLTLNAPNLHVKGSSASGAFHLVQRLQAGSDANDSGAALLINHSNDRGLLIEAGRGGAGAEPDDQAVAHFGLINSSGVNSRFMTARQGGNVGIGTTSPSYKLEVVGNSTSGILAVRNAANARDTFRSENAAGTRTFNIGNDANGHGLVLVRGSGGTATSQIAGNGDTFFDTDTLYIDHSANRVGIGTAAPVAKFHVYQNDTAVDTTAGITIEQDGTGDAALSFLLSGTKRWRMGIDNSDSDKFKISDSTNLASGNKLTIDASGNVGIGDVTPEAKLKIYSGATSTDSNTLRVEHTRSDADVPTNAAFIDMNLSGADNTTADRINAGLKIDLDSSANGDAGNEHRVYGVDSDVRFTGFSDIVRGGHFSAESNYAGGKTSQLAGLYGSATHDANSASGGVSNMYGVFGTTSIQDLGDVDNTFGGYFKVNISTSRGAANVGVTKGVEGEIQIDKDAAIDYGEMIGVSSIIDNREGSVPNFGTQYLFKGDYQGTKGANAYGIYVEGDKNYFEGNVGIGTTSPAAKLHAYNSAGGDATDKAGMLSEAVMKLQPHASNSTNMLFAQVNGGSGMGIQVTNGPATANWDIALSPFGGNVGIGTTSPSTDLTIKGTNSSNLKIETPSGQGSGYINTLMGNTPYFRLYQSTGNRLQIGAGDSNINRFNSSNSAIDLSFATNGGNVGIGTTSPAAKLDVYSAASFRADVATGNPLISIVNNTATSNTAGTATIKFTQANTQTGGKIVSTRDGNYSSGSTRASNLDFYTSTNAADTIKMRIDSVGNVGIGTASPNTKLHIDDDAAIGTGLLVTGGGGGGPLASFTRDVGSTGTVAISSSGGDPQIRLASASNTFALGVNGSTFEICDNGTVGANTRLSIDSSGNATFAGNVSIAEKLIHTGDTNTYIQFPATNDKIVFATNGSDVLTLDATNTATFAGHLSATTKSFLVDNPKTGGKLQYGVVESNEHGVYVRGKTDQEEIELPEEWKWLVDEDSVTVDLTSIGQMQHLFIIEQTNTKVKVGGMATNGQYNYVIYGTRKDVDPLEINI